MTTKAQGKKPGAFSGLGDMMNMGGFDDIFAPKDANKPTFSLIKAADIQVLPQQRNADEMETEEQTIADLGASILADGLLQPIGLVANADGSWRLIFGERRLRACMLVGHDPIESLCYESLTDEQIQRIQFAENIQRLNLSQINEAQILKNDIDLYGGIEAVMAIRNKSASWISKRLSLLDLPIETTRLLKENITADLEVINAVKQIEKIDPVAAAEAVIELKESAGKKGSNARDTVKKAKEKVKPPKPKTEKAKPVNAENIAKPKDNSFMDAGPVIQIDPDSQSNESEEEQQDFDFNDLEPVPLNALNTIYDFISGRGKDPKLVYKALPKLQREAVEGWLEEFYHAGKECKNLGNAVIQGFRNNKFGDEGYKAYALIAFLNGSEDGVTFNCLDILGTVKPQ
ncbi:ParB/RepB/Spo0J family partition protein [Cellvibrio sp. OA-2007]|nr:ParB/RepB/Spo0J family partition protein [Cellvibrio sp. OA-2007]